MKATTWLSYEEDSNFKGDAIYGYMAEADTATRLAAISSEGVLNARKDNDSDAASTVVPTVLLGSMEGQYTQHSHPTIDTTLT